MSRDAWTNFLESPVGSKLSSFYDAHPKVATGIVSGVGLAASAIPLVLAYNAGKRT